MSEDCVFCGIVRGTEPASIVWQDELTMAFMDHRQFHAGHTLVIPRQHLPDIRELSERTAAATARAMRVTDAMSAAPVRSLSSRISGRCCRGITSV